MPGHRHISLIDIKRIHVIHFMYMEIIHPEKELLFLRRVGASIYANPFTPARHEADCRLTGLAKDTDPDIVLQQAIHMVNSRVRALIATHQENLHRCDSRNRPALANLVLFFLFHKYLPLFDLHIQKQNQTAQSLPLDFGKKLKKNMTAFGFSNKDSCQYIGLFFQMRRAFFFIHTSLIGNSPCMEQLRARLWNTLFTYDIGEYAQNLIDKLEDFSTLLVGETGTGKGLAAPALFPTTTKHIVLHQVSPGPSLQLISVNTRNN